MTLDAQLLIDGAWRAAQGGATAASVNPADGRTIGRYAAAGLADAHGAIAAARWGRWPMRGWLDRFEEDGLITWEVDAAGRLRPIRSAGEGLSDAGTPAGIHP